MREVLGASLNWIYAEDFTAEAVTLNLFQNIGVTDKNLSVRGL